MLASCGDKRKVAAFEEAAGLVTCEVASSSVDHAADEVSADYGY